MDDIKNRIEAILFTTGRFMTVDEIAQLCGIGSIGMLKEALQALINDYNTRNTSLEIFEDSGKYKLNIKKSYNYITTKLVDSSELDRPTQETLAIIAYKQPSMQSDVIKIRGTGAYDHIKILREQEFIISEKHGRTRALKLAPKFFEYFDVIEDQLKEKLGEIEQKVGTVEEVQGTLIEHAKGHESPQEAASKNADEQTGAQENIGDSQPESAEDPNELPHEEEGHGKISAPEEVQDKRAEIDNEEQDETSEEMLTEEKENNQDEILKEAIHMQDEKLKEMPTEEIDNNQDEILKETEGKQDSLKETTEEHHNDLKEAEKQKAPQKGHQKKNAGPKKEKAIGKQRKKALLHEEQEEFEL